MGQNDLRIVFSVVVGMLVLSSCLGLSTTEIKQSNTITISPGTKVNFTKTPAISPSVTSSITPTNMPSVTPTPQIPVSYIEKIPKGQYLVLLSPELDNRGRIVSISLNVLSLDGSFVAPLAVLPGGTNGIDLSPDGSKIAFSESYTLSGGPDLYIYDLHNNTIEKIANTRFCWYPSWSPDSKYISAMCDFELAVLSVADGKLTYITHDHASNLAVIGYDTWSPDGTTIAFVRAPEEPPRGVSPGMGIYLTNVSCLKKGTACKFKEKGPVAAPIHSFYEEMPVWSPDGNSIAIFDHSFDHNELKIYDLQKGSAITLSDDESYCDPTWSLDGLYIYCHSHEDVFRISVKSHKKEVIKNGMENFDILPRIWVKS